MTAKAVEKANPGRHGDGAGLYLVVSATGSRKWVYRFSWGGKVTEMGLGSADVVGLAEARNHRDEQRKVLASGRNPIEARRAGSRTVPTFGALADEFFETKKPEWRHQRHVYQWEWALKVGCAPLRGKPVDAIEVTEVLSVLKPLWLKTPSTASRLRQRIEAILNAAKARGFRSGENPAAWRGHLEHLLPKRKKLSQGHYPAMPYEQVPYFMARLRAEEALSAKALEFTILTACRSNEVFGARWKEIDKTSKVWVIPKERMKGGIEHRVPLSARAMEILKDLAAARTGEFVSPSPRGDKPLSHVAMQRVLGRMDVTGVTVHGFRSSFRDWCGHETNFSREIAEQALAHRLGDEAELSYKRGDFLEKRRGLMEAWSGYCQPIGADNVLKFTKSGGAPA
ncbi:integrase arm-type DNA-binding domain-containing protein [Methylocystis sp. MJC1]|uniref:tyrosine-type recombinase/integrase n=1 Tax=Methylocystis sp. MJC1 TaxID=2654282 RepID=UPI001FEFBEBE|nr:site-specific integrase [Methylocystis sp. MJC1]UZX12826.1 integrase arm-type DNA-binding domain-containing protein [Methylocystis sp. MJC1]